MKCKIYHIEEIKSTGWINECLCIECKSIANARKVLNNERRFTKNYEYVKNDNIVVYYEIRYKFTEVGYDTTSEKWYVK